MASIAPELKSRLKQNPNARVNLIVRMKDAPDAHVADVQARGLTVRHVYVLISAMAIQGTAAASLTLTNEKWVRSIEEDKAVRTMA
jgi:hypothetical protein